jgi:protein-S-isoprenylcysteine O-methyltransferase Ste14
VPLRYEPSSGTWMVADGSGPSRDRSQAMAWTFVAVQVILLALIVVLPRGASYEANSTVTGLGYLLMFVGGALGIWAGVNLGRGLTQSPLPNGAIGLVTKGPYRFVRHPMYSALMILSIGIAIEAGSVPVWVAVVGLGLLFAVKARWEEAHLIGAFPGYADYIKSTPRFVPRTGSRNHV